MALPHPCLLRSALLRFCSAALLQVIDKVGFIMNNITLANLDSKIRELRGLVKPDLHPWFANYLVVKRAAQVRGKGRGCGAWEEREGWVWALRGHPPPAVANSSPPQHLFVPLLPQCTAGAQLPRCVRVCG